jgi:hypothetical protein
VVAERWRAELAAPATRIKAARASCDKKRRDDAKHACDGRLAHALHASLHGNQTFYKQLETDHEAR